MLVSLLTSKRDIVLPIQSLGDGKGIATSVCTGVSLVYPTSNGYIQIRGRALSYYLRDEELRYKGEEKERRPPTPRLSKTHTFVLLPLDPRVSPARSGRHVPLFLISPASSLTATVDREVRKEEEEERDREDGAEGGGFASPFSTQTPRTRTHTRQRRYMPLSSARWTSPLAAR